MLDAAKKLETLPKLTKLEVLEKLEAGYFLSYLGHYIPYYTMCLRNPVTSEIEFLVRGQTFRYLREHGLIKWQNNSFVLVSHTNEV